MALTRHLVRPAGLAAMAASALALACSSGGSVSEPAQDRIEDTYVSATATMLDTAVPCPSPPSCEPEMYECRSRDPIYVGRQWTLRADVATAGAALLTGSKIVITATDTTRRTALAIEFLVSDFTPPSGGGNLSPDPSSENIFFDVDTECDHVSLTGPESWFRVAGAESLTLTQASVDGTGLVHAESDGSGGFSPPGIFEGRFSFEGTALQATPTGSVIGRVRVDGCFRVNVPSVERGVPVTPALTCS